VGCVKKGRLGYSTYVHGHRIECYMQMYGIGNEGAQTTSEMPVNPPWVVRALQCLPNKIVCYRDDWKDRPTAVAVQGNCRHVKLLLAGLVARVFL